MNFFFQRSLFSIFLSIFTAFILISCSGRKLVVEGIIKDGKYDSEYPQRSFSPDLEKILQSVRKIITSAYYVSYHFQLKDSMTVEKAAATNLSKVSFSRSYYTRNAGGTATLLSKGQQRYLFLTCAHVLDFPDTTYFFYPKETGELTKYIHSVAIKVRQNNQIPEFGEVTIIASDREADLALVGFQFKKDVVTDKPPLMDLIPPLTVKLGNPKDLQWGSLLYLIGFPQGLKMITTGITSIPDDKPDRKILTDAPFNPGASGAIVLALRDGEVLELVGIANAVSAEDEQYLVPETGKEWDPTVSFYGNSFVRKRKLINYGITFVIPVNQLISFLNQHREEIISRGYFLPDMMIFQDKKTQTDDPTSPRRRYINFRENFQF